jgi:uncharacterized membrane protein (DUF373 family)
MAKFLKLFELWAILALVGMLSVVVILSIGELAWILLSDILSPPFLILQIDELLDLYGFFLLILMGLELIESIHAYQKDRVIHSEIVLTVAMIALARKIIILDAADYQGLTVMGIGFMLLALAAAYYLIKRSRNLPDKADQPNPTASFQGE